MGMAKVPSDDSLIKQNGSSVTYSPVVAYNLVVGRDFIGISIGSRRLGVLMRILIDGYNLLFQSGLGGRARGPGWVQRARGQLIDLLHSTMDAHWATATVIVFDKSQGKETQRNSQTDRGLKIVFAIDHPEADDRIEELIQAHSSPKSLMVVSSDLRVKRKAMARRARPVNSEEFLRLLEQGQFLSPPTASTRSDDSVAHDQPLSEAEIQFWLREFGDV